MQKKKKIKKYEHGGSTPSSYNRRYSKGGKVKTRGGGAATKGCHHNKSA